MSNEDDEQFGTLLLNGKPLFESAWLKAADLNGKDVQVTIDSVERCEVFNKRTNKKEFKVAMMFAGKKKGLICNKTNASTIAKCLGTNEATQWKGGQIVIYPTTCKVGRGMSDCIRVRDRKPTTQRTPKPDTTDLSRVNEVYQGIDRRITDGITSADADQISTDINTAENDDTLTQQEAAELYARLNKVMA